LPDRLTNLLVQRVAFVPRGDNPGADVVLWKSQEPRGARIGGNTFTSTADGITIGKAVDDSEWDGNAAMSKAKTAADYRAICAGRKSGESDQRGSWALPHHKSAGSPPNAAGVRNALARLGQTQGLTNAEAARKHLEAHMASIRGSTTKAPRLTEPRLERLRGLHQQLGEFLTEAGGKGDHVSDTAEKHELPDDLPEEARAKVEQVLADAEKAKADAEAERDAAKDELEKATKPDEPTDPFEKAMADPDLSADVKAVLKAQREQAATEHQAREESDAKLAKEIERREIEEQSAKVRGWKHLALKDDEVAPMLRDLGATKPELGAKVEEALTRVNAFASEAFREIGKVEAGPIEAYEKLQQLAKARADVSGGKQSPEQALADVLRTEEGRALNAEYQRERAEQVKEVS